MTWQPGAPGESPGRHVGGSRLSPGQGSAGEWSREFLYRSGTPTPPLRVASIASLLVSGPLCPGPPNRRDATQVARRARGFAERESMSSSSRQPQDEVPGMPDQRAAKSRHHAGPSGCLARIHRPRDDGVAIRPWGTLHDHRPSPVVVRTASEPSGARVNQDLRDVCEKNVLTNGRSALLLHRGHATLALLCSLIERVTRTSRLHLLQ